MSAYGASKLAGERETAQENPNHAVLRTAWIYAPEGKNFVRTMLRLAKSRAEVGVVADQLGNPTSADDIAAAVAAVAINLRANPHEPTLRGVFHVTAQGETTWAGFAEAIFKESAARGGPKRKGEGDRNERLSNASQAAGELKASLQQSEKRPWGGSAVVE